MAKVIIRDARLAFPDLFEATQFNGSGPFTFRATLLIPENSQLKKQIDVAIKEVAVAKWAAKAEKMLPGILASSKTCCWTDGDNVSYNGYAGNWALVATRNQDAGRPVLVDRAKNPLSAQDGKLYSGSFVNATIELWAQDNSFGKAIRATLVNVQFVKDGESFGGAAPASADGLDDLGYEDDDEDLI